MYPITLSFYFPDLESATLALQSYLDATMTSVSSATPLEINNSPYDHFGKRVYLYCILDYRFRSVKDLIVVEVDRHPLLNEGLNTSPQWKP